MKGSSSPETERSTQIEYAGQRRTVTINGEPYFVGKDVAESLGYERTADAIRQHVDKEDKGVGEIPTPGGKQKMTIINESGLYALIFGSKLESAKRFKHEDGCHSVYMKKGSSSPETERSTQ